MNFSKSRLLDLLFLLAVCGVVAILGALLLFSAPKSFSEKENRALSGAPRFSLDNLSSGDFLDDLSRFCADQFPFREHLTDVKARCEISLGKRENNGVLITESKLIELGSPCNALDESIDALVSIKRNIDAPDKLTLLCAPRSADVNCADVGFDLSYSQNAIYSRISDAGICTPDLLCPLREAQSASDDVWYSTDHHWSTHGAYVAYRELLSHWGIAAYEKEFFDIKSISHSFWGTTYSKSGITDYSPDNIYLYRFEGDEDFCVEYVAEGKALQGFYDLEKLEEKDKYSLFLGGNFAELKIRSSGNATARPRLLLIKDSFANSIIPFLSLHFDIDVIDPRYFTGSVSDVANAYDYDKILILCGVQTLATDASFGKGLKK